MSDNYNRFSNTSINNKNNKDVEIATIANGCFWCTEAIFSRVKGIKSVMPGYSGGTANNPSYEQVCTGKTGYAEAIQIKFDPRIITFEKILDILWHTHDPTTLNRQGNDVGHTVPICSFITTKIRRILLKNQKMNLKRKRFQRSNCY